MTGTNCDLFTHKSSRSYLNHLVFYKMRDGENRDFVNHISRRVRRFFFFLEKRAQISPCALKPEAEITPSSLKYLANYTVRLSTCSVFSRREIRYLLKQFVVKILNT
jgi:hypothetical protein